MTLKKFFESDVDEGAHELYILRKGRRILYIGISERGVWNRWFGNLSAHMLRNGWGEFYPSSQAGRAVIENFPKSWSWTLELWTIKDCTDFLSIPYHERMTIHYVEPLMIRKLKPSLNTVFVNYATKDGDLINHHEDETRAAHRKIFG